MSSLLSSGRDGCVYKPSFSCPDKSIDVSPYVSKLIKTTSLPSEYNEELVELLKRKDPAEKFVIRPLRSEEVCKGAPQSAIDVPQDIIGACPAMYSTEATGFGFGAEPTARKDAHILYQSYAGPQTLADVIVEDMRAQNLVVEPPPALAHIRKPSGRLGYVSSKRVIDLLNDVMRKQKFLLDNGYVHADIGLHNVMVLPDNTVRLIDTAGIQKLSARLGDPIELIRTNIKSSFIPKLNGYIPFPEGVPAGVSIGGRRKTRKSKRRHKRTKRRVRS